MRVRRGGNERGVLVGNIDGIMGETGDGKGEGKGKRKLPRR